MFQANYKNKNGFTSLWTWIFCLFMLTGLGLSTSIAQVSLYTFSQSTTTYTPVSGGTVIGSGNQDDVNESPVANIGFNFVYHGVTFTTIGAQDNGHAKLGSLTGASGYSGVDGTALTTEINTLAIFNGDLLGWTGAPTHQLRCATTGSPGSQVFTLEWFNWSCYNSGSGVVGGEMNFQIKLFEGSNLIQYVYQPVTPTIGRLVQVGMTGATTSDFITRTTTTNWSSTTAGGTNAVRCTYSSSIYPSNGLTFTFTPPPPCVAPVDQASGLVLTPISTSQINGSFTAAGSAPSGYLVVGYPTGSSPTGPTNGTVYSPGQTLGLGKVVTSGAATTFSATGLSGGTTYDAYIYSYNNSLCSGGPTYNLVSPLTGTASTNACGGLASGTYAVGPTAPASPAGFPTLGGAGGALAYLSTNGLTGAVTLELQTDYLASAETYPIVMPYNACVGPVNNLTIRPAAGVGSVINFSSANTTATIDMNGANYITIDGRPGGTGSAMLIAVTNTSSTSGSSGPAILLRNDATNNIIRYVDIAAATLNATTTSTAVGNIPGAVNINTTAGTGGNDNNTFTNCNIHSTGTTLLYCVIGYNGTTAGSSANNDNNTITNCNIYDFFSGGSATAGIKVDVGCNNWTITNNNIYQSASRAYTASNTHRAIWVTPNTASLTSASGFVITGNFIGGGGANATGATPFTAPLAAYTMTGAFANVFNAMDISVGLGTATSVQNNTITNFNISTTSGAGFIGISQANGNVNIGTTTGNIVGAATGNGAIVVTTTATGGGVVIGIRTTGGTGTTNNVSNNTVGGFNLVGTATLAVNFIGINVTGGGTVNVSNNLVGSLTTSNSINASFATTGTQSVTGISVSSTTAGTVTNNTVANMNDAYTGTSTGQNRGIFVSTAGITAITGNTIRNLTDAGAGTGTGSSSTVMGISYTGAFAGINIANNIIHSLSLTGSSTTAAVNLTGLYYSGASSATNNIQSNFIHSFGLTANNPNAVLTGVDAAGGIGNFFNNMIRLGIDASGSSVTTGATFRGFAKGSSSNMNFYYNTVYIGGTGVNASTFPTFAFRRTTSGTSDDVRNNIFVNNRSNLSSGANHYCVALSALAAITLNYNDLVATGTGGFIGSNNLVTNYPTLATWQSATGQEGASRNEDPTFVNSTGNAGAVNLHVNYGVTPTFLESGGVVISGFTTDYDAQSRPGPAGSVNGYALAPDIGADEFDGVSSIPQCSGAPTAGNASLTPIAGCPTASGNITMTATGYTSGVFGITFQWETSSNNVSWTPISGATTPVYTTTTPLTVGTYVHCVVSCSYSGQSSSTPSVQVQNGCLNYNVTQSNTPFNSVFASATNFSWGGTSTDDQMSNTVSLAGTTFTYGGSVVSGMRASTNGLMTFNTTTTASVASPYGYQNAIGNASTNGNLILAPFWEDLVCQGNPSTVAGLNNSLRYLITGTLGSGSAVISIEWTHMETFQNAGPDLNFQVKLFESDNHIEFNYGVMQGFNGVPGVGGAYSYSYTVGLNGTSTATNPAPGEVLTMQQENSKNFSNSGGQFQSVGANKLSIMPNCNSRVSFIPGSYVPFTPTSLVPVNDDPAGAVLLPALVGPPSDLCGTFFTSRLATATSVALAPASCVAGANADDDVWFKFNCIASVTTLKVYSSGGYDAAVEVFDGSAYPTLVNVPSTCVNATAEGLIETINLTGLTVLNDYYVRVYHKNGGTQATATATVSGGVITAINIVTGGSGYQNAAYGGAVTTAAPKISITDATGTNAVATVVTSGTNASPGAITSITVNGGGSGYSATPTVTIDPPGAGVTGDFAITVFATPVAPANDNICTANSLTVGNNVCTPTSGTTFAATASPQASCTGTPDDDVWYSFVATASSTQINVQGATGFDAAIEVFSSSNNTCSGTLTSLGCVDATAISQLETFLPSGIVTGNTYFIRVYDKRSATGGGNFTVCVMSIPPVCPTLTSPADLSNNVNTPVNLTWNSVSGATGYDVYIDNNNPPTTLVSSNQAGLSYIANGLASNSLYYWSVKARNSGGPSVGCTAFSFSTALLCQGQPTAGTTAASPVSVCVSGTSTISLSGYTTGSAGIGFQWQSAGSVGGPFTDISGAILTSYTPASITADTYYRCVVTCTNSGLSDISSVVGVTFNNPSVTGTTPGSTVCGNGTVTLQASGSAGSTLSWYTAASGGAPVGAGSPFTTPVISSNTTYYVAAVQGGGSTSVGLPNNAGSYGTYGSPGGTGYGLYFTTISGTTIVSVKVYPFTTGTCTIELQDGSGVLIPGQTYTATFGSGDVGVLTTVPLNFVIPSAGSYRLMNTVGVDLGRFNPYSGPAYPLTYGPITLTQGSLGTTTYYSFFDWVVSSGCESARTAVLATYTTPPAITVSSGAASVCAGNPTTVSVTSANPYTYSWTSTPSGFTASGAGPHTVTPTGSVTYNVSGTDGTCNVSGSVTVNGTANNISLSASSTPAAVCSGQNAQLNAAASVGGAYCVATGGTGTYYMNDFSTTGGVTNITNNASGYAPSGYANYSSTMSVTKPVGGTITWSASNFTVGTYGVAVLVDWNQDGDFDDANEQTYNSAAYVTSATSTITVPAGAYNGSSRMRVVVDYFNTTPGACDVSTSHETEDYSFIVTGGIPNNTGNFTYDWTLNSTYLSATNISNPVAQSVTAPQTYTVKVTDTGNGCTKSATTALAVNPIPDLSTSGGGTACAGNGITLSVSNNASGQSSGNTYAWTTDAVTPFTSTQQTPSVTGSSTPNNSGNYTVVVTNSFLCTSSAVEVVTVTPSPALSIVSTQNVGCVGGSDGSITVGATGAQAPYDFTSDFINFVNDPAQGTITNLPTGSTTIYVSDGNGCNSQISASLTAISTVPPSANVIVPFIGMPANVCSGTTATLSIPSVSNATMYIWDAPAGAYFNGSVLNVSPFTTSTPSVTVTYGNPSGSLYSTGVQAANGCGASIRKIQKTRGTVSVPAAVSGALTACASSSGTYSTGAIDAASSYLWTVSGDATVSGTGTTATVTFGPAWNGGTLCVSAQTTCYTSAAKCISISKNAAALGAISGTFTACPNTTLSYNVPVSSGAASYAWTVPTGASVSSGQGTNSVNVTFAPGYSAVGSICVSVTSVCGVTSALKCKTVAPGLPTVPASITGASSGLCGQTIAYSCPSQGGGTTYNWTSPGTINSGQGSTSISTTFASLTTGSVCVTASNSCGSSAARCVAVKGAPNAPGAITATPSSWCANTAGIEFSTSTSALTGSYTLSWAYPPAAVVTYAFGGGNSTSLILDWKTGSGNVNVTASNACGASTKTSTWSSTCREGSVAMVSSMSVSPNPTTGVININYTASKGSTVINVLDLAGRVVMTENTNSVEGVNNTQLDMSKLAKGAYMLSVQSTQGNKQVRVVVE